MTTELSTEWWKKKLGLHKDILGGRTYTPEEAKSEFNLDLGKDWKIKAESYDSKTGQVKFTAISPEGWQVKSDDTFISPEGKSYTRSQLESEQKVYEQQTLGNMRLGGSKDPGDWLMQWRRFKEGRITKEEWEAFNATASEQSYETQSPYETPLPTPESDYQLLYKEYQRTGGQLGWEDWLYTGSPLRPESEVSITDAMRRLYPDKFPTGQIEAGTFKPQEQIVGDILSEVSQNPQQFVNDVVSTFDQSQAENVLHQFFDFQPEEFTELYEAIKSIVPEEAVPEGRAEPYTMQELVELKRAARARGEKNWRDPRTDKLEPTDPFVFIPSERQMAYQTFQADPKTQEVYQILGFVGLVGSIVLGGWQIGTAIRDITQFSRLPQYRVLEKYAKDNNIPKDSQVFKDASNSLRLALSLKRVGADEAADEIITRFTQTYEKTLLTAEQQASVNMETFAISRGLPSFIPKGTQTGAMAFGGKTAGLTSESWKAIPIAQKLIDVKAAGLAEQVASKAFEQLTPEEVTALGKVISESKAPLVEAVRTEQESIVAQAEKLSPDNPNVIRMRELLNKGDREALAQIDREDLETKVKELISATPKEAPTEVKPVEAKPVESIEAPKVEIPQITTDVENVVKDIQSQIDKITTSIKGQKGEAARIGRETVKGLQRELDFANKTLESFKEQPNVPDATKLRQNIMAVARFKGIPKTQLQKIVSEVGGRRQLRSLKSPQLVEILNKIREARPVRIKSKKVITPKTEKKIQTLKENLITSRQLNDRIYNKILERMNLKTDKYESVYRYIGESEGKELIRSMNDEAILAKYDLKVEDALANHPEIQEVWKGLNDRGMTGTGVEFDGKPIEIKRRNELWSMRYYMLELQKKLGAPVYDVWQKINMAHLVARDRHNQQLARLEQTTPDFKEIATDESALKRIEDYIASKHDITKTKPPTLSEGEQAVADELERGYFEAQNDVRYIRFLNAYAENEGDIDLIAKEIPSAPKRALRRAIDVYEGNGVDALREFTDTQKWGVVEKGYDPKSFIKPNLFYREPGTNTFAKGFLRTRSGTEYPHTDRNILQRYATYQRQLIALQEMSGLIRAFGRLYAEAATKLESHTQSAVSEVISRDINQMKGYNEKGGFLVHMIERLYGQVASAVFWRPDLVLRNKFQNFAFNPDYWAGRFLDPATKPSLLSKERRRWFEVFVSQERALQFEYMLYAEKPFKGFDRLTRAARKTSLYPWSDKSNRIEAYSVRLNRVGNALKEYEKHGDIKKLIKDSGLDEFEPRQQAEALELLAMDSVDYGIDGMPSVTGKEAFALYNAQQLVNNVHILYDRAQRAPAEMGATGKTLGNILVFPRSWGERFILQGRKLDPKAKVGIEERLKALRVIIGIIVAGTISGETYKRVTGKSHNPYSPLNIFQWSPGGLSLGVTEDISNVIYLITQAAQGDKGALGALPSAISGVATLTLPFYKNTIQALDAATNKKNIDVYAMRKIRELIDDEYEVRGGTHDVERTLLERVQRALFGKYDEPATPNEKAEEAESFLGTTIEEEDKPFSIEEPDIYGMSKLSGRFYQIYGDRELPEDVSKKVVAWREKETVKAVYDTYPNQKIYNIKELTDEQSGWAKENRRLLTLVGKLQTLKGADRDKFIEEHPELKVNPATEWLKENPIENAQLALWGHTKLYSTEAYNEFVRLVKTLDIPDDAIPEQTLPPRGSIDNYFKLQDVMSQEGMAWNSWEAQIIYAKDDALREFMGYKPVETPLEALELKIKHRDEYKQYDTLETDEDRAKFKLENPEWVDDMRRVEALENNGVDYQEQWVERGHVIDEFNASSSEAKVWLLDNPDIFKWALDNQRLEDDGSDWNEPVLRLNVKWRENDDLYNEYGDGESENYIEDEIARQQARDRLLENENYRKDRRRRDAYTIDFPDVEGYVNYYELPERGKRRDRMLLENEEFGKAMYELVGIDIPEKVPSVEYDDIYDQYQNDFERWEGLADFNSEYYIEDANERQQTYDDMRFSKGRLTEFGKAMLRRNAYGLYVPDNHIDDYVSYYTITAEGKPKDYPKSLPYFEDNWWMLEHRKFHDEVWVNLLENEPYPIRRRLTDDGTEYLVDKDGKAVEIPPTRELGAKSIEYEKIDNQKDRDQYRLDNPDLDKWGVAVGIWTKTMSERRKALKKTTAEREIAELEENLEDWRKKLEEAKNR